HALGEAILREARSHTGKSVRDVAENVAQELAPYLSPEQISFSALCGKGIQVAIANAHEVIQGPLYGKGLSVS
ncbi:MAG: hypothetical protein J0L97_04205, partial [Alphaproteobacteria bacterium]|nr:hypothetical protein [Alphaproteobacteria bacterium]